MVFERGWGIGACSSLVTSRPGIAVPPGAAHCHPTFDRPLQCAGACLLVCVWVTWFGAKMSRPSVLHTLLQCVYCRQSFCFLLPGCLAIWDLQATPINPNRTDLLQRVCGCTRSPHLYAHALHTYRINLSPFTKDFRVWGVLNETYSISLMSCPLRGMACSGWTDFRVGANSLKITCMMW